MSLPYYTLYPKDFDADENVRLMEDEELGFYLRCMNHAWENDGLPEDPDEIRRIFREPQESFTRKWARVSKCFPVAPSGRRRNKRQEEERAKAVTKINRTKAANEAKEQKRAQLRDVNVNDNDHEKKQERATRASDSGSDSGVFVVVEFSEEKTSLPEKPRTVPVEPESRKLEIVSPEDSVERIVRDVGILYRDGGKPAPDEHLEHAARVLVGHPPEHRPRLRNYVANAFASGQWPNPAKTKSLYNVLRDGDWNVEITPRVLPKARDPDSKQDAERQRIMAAVDRLSKRPEARQT